MRGPGRRVDGQQPGRLEAPTLDDEATVAAPVVGRRRHLEANEHELSEAGGEVGGVGGQRGSRGPQTSVSQEHLQASPARVVDDPRTDLVAVPQVHHSGGVPGDVRAGGGGGHAVLGRVEGDLERERPVLGGALGGPDRVGEEDEGEAGGGAGGGGGGEEKGGGEGGVGGERKRERE